MSRIMFVLRYRNGEPESLDMGLVREVLEPYAVAIGPDLQDGVLIRTADGHEAEVDVKTSSAWPSAVSRPAGSSPSWPSWWTASGRA
ncbi:hypothetical protein OG264_02865 [Streptomyces xanthophaeus]|uniref:hypothetical protein n=1 Tax=Streptomyces xanthophaeus TaxID=67385 RepID=UPI00386FC86B|nr:hypothetical protein OG264_02865 [Streptomyces xanthophaeus]WST64481.1 hypothetical protein OG605_35495 [Streptomyces xanthophaeus]